MATICLPLITVETGEIVTATSLEMQIMESLNASAEEVTEVEMMTKNCYEVTITEKQLGFLEPLKKIITLFTQSKKGVNIFTVFTVYKKQTLSTHSENNLITINDKYLLIDIEFLLVSFMHCVLTLVAILFNN